MAHHPTVQTPACMQAPASIQTPTSASTVATLPRPRQRIDWSVLSSQNAVLPVWDSGPAVDDTVALLSTLAELSEHESTDRMLRHAVELALQTIGLVRAGIYLYDEPAALMLGAWGTDMDGRVVDEHHAMFSLGEHGQRVFDDAISGRAAWTVIENCPLIDQRARRTSVVGQGWVVCTPIVVGRKRLGMLYNDAGSTRRGIDPQQQARAAMLCSLVGVALRAGQHSNQFDNLPSTTARHPTLRKAVHKLSLDPSSSGQRLARELGISSSRLARLFKTELGISMVDYRNQLRMERLLQNVERRSGSLLQAALDAGFGSYAQFHRVFRAMRGESPRDYFAARGCRIAKCG